MPMLLGFILGIALTVAGAYAYDASTGRTVNGLAANSADGEAPLVNWSVVGDDWASLRSIVEEKADNLERKLKQHG